MRPGLEVATVEIMAATKSLLVVALALAIASPAWAQVLYVIDSYEGHPHRKNIEALFKKELGSCPVHVEYRNLYNSKGDLLEEPALKVLKEAEQKADLVHLSWNLPMNPGFSKIVAQLNRISQKKILVGASGAPQDGVLTAKLSTTVMGQVQGAILIGELNSKGHLALNSYYGPELLTALRAPDAHPGSSFSSVIFTSRLACAYAKDSKKNWKESLRKRKEKSGLTPSLRDLGLELLQPSKNPRRVAPKMAPELEKMTKSP